MKLKEMNEHWFIHPLVNGHFVSFFLVAVMSDVTMNGWLVSFFLMAVVSDVTRSGHFVSFFFMTVVSDITRNTVVKMSIQVTTVRPFLSTCSF